MAAITERLGARMLAATEGYAFRLGNLHLYRTEFGPLMGTITERLFIGMTTPAPIVGTGFDVHHIRASLGDFRFLWHCILP